MSKPVELEMKKLESLMKAFKGPLPEAKVGILGSAVREDGSSNASVGAAHEFGTSKLPVRSFLRIPISENLEKYLSKAGAFDKAKLKEVIRSGSMLAWVKKVAVTAEAVVQDAFASAGFGKWKQSNMSRKKVHQVLIETQQLRNSVTSVVK